MINKSMFVALAHLIPLVIMSQEIAPGLHFLKLGIGARACAMGEAFAAIADDGSASYWNPAGLGGIDDLQLFVMHAQWYMGTRFEYLSGTIPVGKSNTISMYTTYLTSGTIEARDEFGRIDPDYENSDVAVGIVYGRELVQNFMFGTGIKFIMEQVASHSGTSFGFDTGVLYKFPFDLELGFVAQNIGTQMKLIEESVKLPITYKLATAFGHRIRGQQTTLAVDFVYDDRMKENIGVEFLFLDILSIRAGYRIGLDQGCFTVGTGITHVVGPMYFQVDYAYVGFSDLGSSHRFSLGLKL